MAFLVVENEKIDLKQQFMAKTTDYQRKTQLSLLDLTFVKLEYA